MESASARPRLALAVEVALAVCVALFSVVFAQEHRSRNIVHPPASLERMGEFTAETPYQRRILVPTVVEAIEKSGLGAKLGLSREDSARGIEIACVIAFFY